MSILAFQRPDKVIMQKADEFKGLFEFRPLEKGYGVTIGNALRRILLSSLEGYAINSIRIPGVLHEFSTIEGVTEDVANIILNLKQIRFKKVGDANDEKVVVRVKGKNEVTGADISKACSGFEVLNPDHVICNMEKTVDFELELTINKGRGYVSAEEYKIIDPVVGQIAIDAIYTPIKNVTYNVENTRVEQKTDYEKLIIELESDGSIHPEDALKGAASILIQHFMLFSDQTMTFETTTAEEENKVDEEMLHMRKLLKTPLADMDLSVRAYNCLKAADIKTLGELAALEVSDMMKFRNFGKKSLTELEALMAEKNLSFGTDISKYNLDD